MQVRFLLHLDHRAYIYRLLSILGSMFMHQYCSRHSTDRRTSQHHHNLNLLCPCLLLRLEPWSVNSLDGVHVKGKTGKVGMHDRVMVLFRSLMKHGSGGVNFERSMLCRGTW